MKMVGCIVIPFLIKLGTVTFPAVVQVSPFNNDMLLGLDFLLKIGANTNLKELHLLVKGATVKRSAGNILNESSNAFRKQLTTKA